MEKVANVANTQVLSWTDDLDEATIEQAKNVARLPFVHSRVCIMADGHLGYGVPIGGVIATTDCVLPYGAGGDIGCGVRLCKTNYTVQDLTSGSIAQICKHIKKLIPTGKGAVNKEEQYWSKFDYLDKHPHTDQWITPKKRSWIEYSLGTLGGGNHFISLELGDNEHLYIMIHSGSRNLGQLICGFYHDKAAYMAKMWYVDLPDPKLAYLPIKTSLGQRYIQDQNFALDFARENRRRMMTLAQNAVIRALGRPTNHQHPIEDVLDVHHNYIGRENHDGQNFWIHRKGAILADDGVLGIIPGSQGTASYIVQGLGNTTAFNSCSHGAGRRMSRKAANKELNPAEESAKMAGIYSKGFDGGLAEAPGAYKNIDQVMANQKDLVKPLTKLTPLGVIKG